MENNFKMRHLRFIRNPKLYIPFLFLCIAFYLCLPKPLFDVPYSQVLFDRSGDLLSAKVADDEQWRFPLESEIPSKYKKALLLFEDQRFYYHLGIDPIGIGRALVQNFREGKVVSGGSTITMQVIRMARKNKPRTIWQKLIETLLAFRLELGYSKKNILKLYAGHAPYGGNVVGLETACWRYFNRPMNQLSWAEAAFLAVLPNSPSSMHPGRNRSDLLAKRDRLLQRMHANEYFDATTLQLSLTEKIPDAAKPLKQEAIHLLDYLIKKHPNQNRFKTAIHGEIQTQIGRLARLHHERLARNGVYNLAVIVANLEGEVISYHGNISPNNPKYSPSVDIIQAPRSTGSILKPFLFNFSLERGLKTPRAIVSDIPIFIDGYSPENATHAFDGIIPFDEALAKSLNIPFVLELQEYGLERFLVEMREKGFYNLNRSANNYGLSLILGGGEVSLFELAQQYLNMGRVVKNYDLREGQQSPSDYEPLGFGLETLQKLPPKVNNPFDPGTAFHTLEAMRELYRPENEGNWRSFNSSTPIAWKTGTSFGAKDAWAVGLNPDFVVGVWAGNADGEGRPGISGIQAAAPLLFTIFDVLPMESNFFQAPLNAMEKQVICAKSGYLASPICPKVDTTLLAVSLKGSAQCPFHTEININPANGKRVHGNCFPVHRMEKDTFFKLPPTNFHYYQKNHPSAINHIPFAKDCLSESNTLSILYPFNGAEIYLPRDLNLQEQSLVAKAFTSKPQTLYWHLNNRYLGSTDEIHQMEINIAAGDQRLTVIDELGNKVEVRFEMLKK